MKTKFLFFNLLVLVAGCTNSLLDDRTDLDVDSSIHSKSISLEEALQELDDFNKAVYGTVDVKSASKIEDVYACGVSATTKSDDNNDSVLAYLVNYEDNDGFAVISTDPRLDPVIARGESGNLDYEKLNGRIEACLNDISTKSLPSPLDTIPGESPEDYVYALIANTLAASYRAERDTISVTYGDWEYNTKYGPHVTVKWNKTYPFNMRMPVDSVWMTKSYSYYRGLPPVGCVNIAVAQILATIEQPTFAPGADANYSWPALRTLSNYYNLTDYLPGLSSYPFDTNQGLMRKVQELADYLSNIAVLNKSTVSASGTGSNIEKVRVTLKNLNHSYFINAIARDFNSNSEVLTACVQAGKPIYCQGFHNNGNSYVGHAWVIDGHASRTRKITSITMNSNNQTQTWYRYQTAEFYHVNWGYSGKYDGYYYIGNFDMSKREGRDENYDTYPLNENSSTVYDQSIKFLSY